MKVIEALAAVRRVPAAALGERVTHNFDALFGRPPRSEDHPDGAKGVLRRA